MKVIIIIPPLIKGRFLLNFIVFGCPCVKYCKANFKKSSILLIKITLFLYEQILGENFMAVGAQDSLDRALVRKYQSLKVDNAIIQSSMVDPIKMMDTMNDYANAHMEAFRIQQALKNICNKAISMNIQYTKMKSPKSKKERIAEAARKVVAAQMAKKNDIMQKLAKEPRPSVA